MKYAIPMNIGVAEIMTNKIYRPAPSIVPGSV